MPTMTPQADASPDPSAYAPVDELKPVAEGVWVVDGEPIRPGGAPVPIRMTIIRLKSGHLVLHSPTQFSPALAAEIDQLGPIGHLVAPSFGHWMFLPDWQNAYPSATTWAAPGLRERGQVKQSGLRIDHDLAEQAPEPWAGEIEQVLVQGGPFTEVAFFHRPTRSLILTDLVQNIEAGRLPKVWRGPARLLGITAPDGQAPAYLRMLLHAGGAQPRDAATRLLALQPERVIFAHGDWFRTGGAARLRRSLSWLLPHSSRREFAGRTVVITGASSGIGRAAALAFARRGAQLVLAARRAEVLEEVARACEALGARAIAAPTDVADSEAVERLAQTAEAAFGRIDVWINNAGVGVFGPFQDTDLALHRRTVEVNLIGTMNGAAAAIPRFLRQGSGTLINNISLGAWSPVPFASAYVASKFGLRGFTASLRQEMEPHRNIHVCGVFPAVVDTPGFAHGGNTSELSLDPGPLLYRAEDVAETFISLVRRPRAEVGVGWPSRATQIAYSAAPRLTERAANTLVRAALSRAKPAPRTDGAVLTPVAAGVSSSGGWLRRHKVPSARILTVGLALGGLTLALAGAAAAHQLQGRRRPRLASLLHR